MSEAPPPILSEFRDTRELCRRYIPEAGASTVLLGESTHGTEEFYQIRADVCKYLIEVRKYKVIIVEADWPLMWHLNEYIHRKRSRMFPNEKGRFPDWMWRNRPFVELIEWMRRKNAQWGGVVRQVLLAWSNFAAQWT